MAKPRLIISNYKFEIANPHQASVVINAQTFSAREEALLNSGPSKAIDAVLTLVNL